MNELNNSNKTIIELEELCNLCPNISTIKIVEIGDKKYFANYCDLLIEVLKCNNYIESLKLLKSVDILFDDLDEKYDLLYLCVRNQLFNIHHRDEFYYQHLFQNFADKLGYKIVSHKNNKKDIPDAWVEKDGEIIPVEVKLNSFDNHSLKQLNRYIKVYNCNKGIAIGRNLSVTLPDNIEFISLSDIERLKDN